MRFVDSHVHLADYPRPLELVRLAKANGTVALANGVDLASSDATLRLFHEGPHEVLPFVGIHPSHAHLADPARLEPSVHLARGIGEIGLDPKYSLVSRGSRQFEAFKKQLGWAEKGRLPVQVHSRGAEKECLQVLSSFSTGRVLMHWFENEQLLPELASRGYFISLGPALLYSKRLQRVALAARRDLILAESDGPVPFAPLGGSSGPALIPAVVFKLSELWKVPFASARGIVLSNSKAFLGIDEKG